MTSGALTGGHWPVVNDGVVSCQWSVGVAPAIASPPRKRGSRVPPAGVDSRFRGNDKGEDPNGRWRVVSNSR